MSERPLIILSSSLALAAEAVVIAGVLLALHRTYRRDYLRLWAWSWRAMAVSSLAAAGSLWLVGKLPASQPARLLLTAVSLTAAYWHVLWLLLGTWGVSGRRPASVSVHRRALLALAGVAFLATLLFAFEPGAAAARFWLRVGVKHFAVGAAFAAAGVWVLRAPTVGGRLGRAMVGVSFLLFGLQQLQYAGLGFLLGEAEIVGHYAKVLAFLDLVLPVPMAVGMVTWLLEEEHDRLLSATLALERSALYDSLTDLPNRTLLQDRLNQALGSAARGDGVTAVAAIDVTGLREINNAFGFRFGDELLRKVAVRLAARLRPGDTLARLGADEFCAVLTGLSEQEAVPAVERLLAGLARPLQVFERELEVRAWVGLALHPQHGSSAAELLTNASRALAGAKADRQTRLAVFDPIRDAERSARVHIESALPRALAAGELSLRYQPIVRVLTGEVAACEALVRWQHPQVGELLPGAFLPAVEAARLDLEISEWVLRTAVTEFAWLHRDGYDRLELAVNLSPRVFQHPAFATLAAAILAESGFDPAMLHLEITETAAMHDADAALAAFRDLKRVGVRIALDDFGTGYSSLSYLRYFPVDVLKIDQSFIRRLRHGGGDSAVVESIISLARTLRLGVTAEGVERDEQARWLADHGCDFMQGHLISPPSRSRSAAFFCGAPSGRQAGGLTPLPPARRMVPCTDLPHPAVAAPNPLVQPHAGLGGHRGAADGAAACAGYCVKGPLSVADVAGARYGAWYG